MARTAADDPEVDELEEEYSGGWWVPGWWLVAVGGVLAIVLGVALWAWADDRGFPDFWDGEPAQAAGGLDVLTNPFVHEHADFALFIDGEQVDFNDPRFLSTEEHHHAEDVHIHPPRTTVVHKHRYKVSWGYFFDTIGMKLEDDSLTMADGTVHANDGTSTLKFFVNGVQVDSLKNYLIQDLDRVLISYGPEAPEDLGTQIAAVTDQACIPSERCVERIPEDEPPEPCSVSDGAVCN